MISLKTEEDLVLYRKTGKIAGEILTRLIPEVKAGVSTYIIAKLAEKWIREDYDAIPSSIGQYNFQFALNSSINNVVCHGVPSKDEILKEGDIVAVGSTLKTGENSNATVTMTTTSAIRLGPNSEAVVAEIVESKEAPKVLLDLKNGTVGALVKPETSGKMDFKIKTPSGTAVAKGAFYSVSVENGKGYVQTKDGEVVIVPLESAATAPAKTKE